MIAEITMLCLFSCRILSNKKLEKWKIKLYFRRCGLENAGGMADQNQTLNIRNPHLQAQTTSVFILLMFFHYLNKYNLCYDLYFAVGGTLLRMADTTNSEELMEELELWEVVGDFEGVKGPHVENSCLPPITVNPKLIFSSMKNISLVPNYVYN